MKHTLTSAPKLAIAEINLANGRARFLKRGCYISACEVDVAREGVVRLNAGFANTKDNRRAARRWIEITRDNDDMLNSPWGADGRYEWALLPYSSRALAEWTNKMAKRR